MKVSKYAITNEMNVVKQCSLIKYETPKPEKTKSYEATVYRIRNRLWVRIILCSRHLLFVCRFLVHTFTLYFSLPFIDPNYILSSK